MTFASLGDAVAEAHVLIEGIRYLTLGTIDDNGRPWTSPVYFAADRLDEYYWVSARESQHSQNIADRPDVSLVVFDSTVPAYHGRCLYAVGTASVASGDHLRRGLEVYPGPPSRGGEALSERSVTGSAPWRLYRAQASAVWVLCTREPGQPCLLHNRTEDHRVRVRESGQ
jgi:hypothetical protein